MEAINACDWKRILAQDPADVEIFSPDGVLAQGRDAVGVMFAQVVRPFKCAVEADAPFLAQPYRGADAYETKDGLMQAQVTTFKRVDLKTK